MRIVQDSTTEGLGFLRVCSLVFVLMLVCFWGGWGSALLTHGRDPTLGGPLGFSLVSLMDNAALGGVAFFSFGLFGVGVLRGCGEGRGCRKIFNIGPTCTLDYHILNTF